jgi:ATP-binding cassette, subfamily B, bacterial MsbA
MVRRLLTYFVPYRKHLTLSLLSVVMLAVTSALLVYLATSLFNSLFGGQPLLGGSDQGVSGGTGLFSDLRASGELFIRGLLFTGERVHDLGVLCITIIIVTLLKNLFFFLQGFFAAYVEQGITKRLRDQIYQHLQKLSLQFYQRRRTGHIISVTINDVSKIQETFNNVLNNLIRDPLMILIYAVWMVVISWQLTLIALVVFPLILLAIYQMGKLIRRYSKRAQEAIADVSSNLEETVNNVRIVRAYAAEAREEKRFTERTARYFNMMLKINRVRLLSSPINEILGVGAMVFILWWGGQQVFKHQLLATGDFNLFIFLMFFIIAPAKSVSNIHVRINEGLAAARRIFDLLDTEPQTVEVKNPVELGAFKKEISFVGVSFKYDTGDTVLHDINFKVAKGQIVAIVGPSGSGKSTLIDLVCRFHDPLSGTITVDGVDLRAVSFGSLRRLLGVVTQETILFNDTVANNIAYPAIASDTERIRQAAAAANAHQFISDMPNGYNTVIGNRGAMVSGGERQRLAIARALMKDPQILIFDEATSSLDTESERLVQEAIDRLMVGRTSIVIAHRLSTILRADLILVLKEGRIVERGRHEELLRLNGVYRRLYDLQFERNDAVTSGAEIPAARTNSEGI